MIAEEFIKVPMKDYYNCRKCIQQLYVNDVQYSGDLAASLLGLRDTIPYIESMSIEIQSFRIMVEITEGTSREDLENLYFKIHCALSEFVYKNIDKVTDRDTADRIRYNIKDCGIKYYEIIQVGNMISFSL